MLYLISGSSAQAESTAMTLSFCARAHAAVWLLPLCAVWTHTGVSAQPVGTARLLAALPAIFILAAAPLLFDYEREPLAVMSTAYLSERLPLTKLLAFCLGRGPLAEHRDTVTLPQFVALMLCPCVIRPGSSGSMKLTPATMSNIVTALSAKGLVLLGILIMLPSYPSRAVQQFAAAIGMYCATSGTLDFFMLICRNLGFKDLAMAFHSPLLSASLAEFWTRWNVPQAQLLRSLVYAPIIEGHLLKPMPQQQQQQQQQQHQHEQGGNSGGREPARRDGRREGPRKGSSNGVRAVAVMVTFLFSGLEHLVFIWYVTRTLHWPWLTFFTVQGVLIIVLEELLPLAWRATRVEGSRLGSSLPRPVRVMLTMALLHATACMWFYEPFLDPVLLGRIMRSFRETQACIAHYIS